MAFIVISYILKTFLDNLMNTKHSTKITFKLLKQITIYPRYEKMAKRIDVIYNVRVDKKELLRLDLESYFNDGAGSFLVLSL